MAVSMMDDATRQTRRLVQEARMAVFGGIEQTREWLASPRGRLYRRRFAQVLLLSAPVILRFRFLRISPLGRLIELAGGAAIVVKIAEAIRDWEPGDGGPWPKVVNVQGRKSQ